KRDIGDVDILINNAGTVTAGRFTSHPVESWDRLTKINLNSIYYTTSVFLPDMYRRNKGHIVNISSGAGLVGLPDLAVYCATKWAVYGFTESLRLEAMADRKNGVRFSSVHPGILKKGLFEGSRMNFLGELLLPRVERHDDIAKAVVNRALKKRRCTVKKPWSLHLGQVARALMPDIVLNRLLIIAGAGQCMQEWSGGNTSNTGENEHA
ncbi:MAG: SDR family NAD(P)-dependent oxidoreductase, partial [Chrysiogenales bacterium]